MQYLCLWWWSIQSLYFHCWSFPGRCLLYQCHSSLMNWYWTCKAQQSQWLWYWTKCQLDHKQVDSLPPKFLHYCNHGLVVEEMTWNVYGNREWSGDVEPQSLPLAWVVCDGCNWHWWGWSRIHPQFPQYMLAGCGRIPCVITLTPQASEATSITSSLNPGRTSGFSLTCLAATWPALTFCSNLLSCVCRDKAQDWGDTESGMMLDSNLKLTQGNRELDCNRKSHQCVHYR